MGSIPPQSYIKIGLLYKISSNAFSGQNTMRSKIIINSQSIEPVSYTHLDVYKRQLMWC